MKFHCRDKVLKLDMMLWWALSCPHELATVSTFPTVCSVPQPNTGHEKPVQCGTSRNMTSMLDRPQRKLVISTPSHGEIRVHHRTPWRSILYGV